MTSARDQAIEVMAQAMLSHAADTDGQWWPRETALEDASAALDALLAATQEQTCPTCGGTGYKVLYEYTGNPPEQESCDACNGAGVVPGTEPLVLLGPKQVGWLTEHSDDNMKPTGEYGVIGGYETDGHGDIRSWRDHDGVRWGDRPVYRRAGSPDA